jgi:hypothetical protein
MIQVFNNIMVVQIQKNIGLLIILHRLRKNIVALTYY